MVTAYCTINIIDFHLINSVFRDHHKNKMHRCILFSLLATAALCLAEETYTDRFDNINVDEIIANRRLLVPYIRCVLDQGRCTPEGRELKIHVKDAMQTACKKCTQKQKDGARKVVNHIREKELEYWDQLITKYDPTGEFKPIYEPFLAGQDPAADKVDEVEKDAETIGDKKPEEGEEKKADLVEATNVTEPVEFPKTETVEETKTDSLDGEKPVEIKESV